MRAACNVVIDIGVVRGRERDKRSWLRRGTVGGCRAGRGEEHVM